MDHLSLFSYSQGQIKTGMKLASGALAAGLPAGALHGDEATAEEGLIVKDLGETGPRPTFRVGQMASRAHGGIPSFRDLSDIFIYIRYPRVVKHFFECEFARGRSWGLKLWNPWRVRKEKISTYGIPAPTAEIPPLGDR
jgi:hypothetical protein